MIVQLTFFGPNTMAPVFMQNIHGKQIGLVTRCAPVSVRTAHPTLSSQQGVGRPAPLLLAKGCLARGSLERCRSLLVLQRPETRFACYNIMYCLYGARCCRIPKRCRSFCWCKGLTETRLHMEMNKRALPAIRCQHLKLECPGLQQDVNWRALRSISL